MRLSDVQSLPEIAHNDKGVRYMSTEPPEKVALSHPATAVLPARATDGRRVVVATIIGTTVEWYDFFVYGSAAGLVFGQLFFAPAGPGVATLLAFLTVGISFLFRPVGAFLAGHFGDKYGRRPVLVFTLILMGASTAIIGLLPTYDTIGVAAPIILILLRVLQGVSAGGEWGGAALMAVEHAPRNKRGLFGASPQIGVPIGLLLASAVLAIMTLIAPGEAFIAWGWRIPFLVSVLLIGVGYWVRRSVDESPVFTEIAARKKQTRMPIAQLFRKHALLVLIAALVFAGNNAVGQMTTGGFMQSYATSPTGLALDRGSMLWAVCGGAVVWLAFTWVGGWLSDRLGRRTTYIVGWILQLVGVFALFPLVNTGQLALFFLGLVILSIGLGLTYGPQAAMYTELFPASIRTSGVSISYAIGAILGGAFSPLIAQALLQNTGSTVPITWYLAGMTVLGLLATLLLRDRTGIPLGIDDGAEQIKSPIYGLANA